MMAEPIDASTRHHLAHLDTDTVVVWIGRFERRQRVERLVQAVDVLATWHRPRAVLLMAGPVVEPDVAKVILRYVAELGLVGSWVYPAAPAPVVEAFRERADVLIEGEIPNRPAIDLAVALQQALS